MDDGLIQPTSPLSEVQKNDSQTCNTILLNHAKREKNGSAERARVLPIKDTSRAHIAQAMSSCISYDDLKMVKSVLKQKSISHSSDDDDDEEEPKKKNAREILNLSR